MPPKKKASSERPTADRDCICIIHSIGVKRTNFVRFYVLPNQQERFDSICKVRERQQAHPLGSTYRQDDICGKIPIELDEHHGYHRECHQRFMNNLNRLKPASDAADATQLRQSNRGGSLDKILFKQNCIFCGGYERKKVLLQGSWTTEGLSYFSHGGGDTILPIAEQRYDEELARRIRGYNLFSCEARYHKHCRIKYCDKTT